MGENCNIPSSFPKGILNVTCYLFTEIENLVLSQFTLSFVISEQYLENICKKSKLKMKLYVFGIALYIKYHFLNL